MNFSAGERILCYHGPLLYEAKILKAELWENREENGPHYFVHYKGWKQSWDEWVPEARMCKFNQENINKQKEIKQSKRKNTVTSSTNEKILKRTRKEVSLY